MIFKSGVALGIIEVRSNPNADLSNLNRDTDQAVNALGKIFDKKTVAEQQELAKVFGEEAFKAVGDISKRAYDQAVRDNDQQAMKDWSEGGANKIALHALVGGVMSDLGGSNFASGAVGAGVNEAIQGELSKRFKDNSDIHQWASVLIGSVAAKVVGGNAQDGASVASSGTKNNILNHRQVVDFQNELDAAISRKATGAELQAIVAKYIDLTNQDNENRTQVGAIPDDGTEFLGQNEFKEYLETSLGVKWDDVVAAHGDYKAWDNLWSHVAVQRENIIIRDEQAKQAEVQWAEEIQVQQAQAMTDLNTSLGDIEKDIKIEQTPVEVVFKEFVYDADKSPTENAHKILNLGGVTPAAPLADGLNAILYIAEGDYEEAAISGLMVVPGLKIIKGVGGLVKLVPET